jgi:hypothetical protein
VIDYKEVNTDGGFDTAIPNSVSQDALTDT